MQTSLHEGIPATNSGIDWRNFEESNTVNLCKDFSGIANSVGSTDNRCEVMNALRTVPGQDVINVYELRQIVRRLENNNAVDDDEIPCES